MGDEITDLGDESNAARFANGGKAHREQGSDCAHIVREFSQCLASRCQCEEHDENGYVAQMQGEIVDEGELKGEVSVEKPGDFVRTYDEEETDPESSMPDRVQIETAHIEAADDEKRGQAQPEQMI